MAGVVEAMRDTKSVGSTTVKFEGTAIARYASHLGFVRVFLPESYVKQNGRHMTAVFKNFSRDTIVIRPDPAGKEMSFSTVSELPDYLSVAATAFHPTYTTDVFGKTPCTAVIDTRTQEVTITLCDPAHLIPVGVRKYAAKKAVAAKPPVRAKPVAEAAPVEPKMTDRYGEPVADGPMHIGGIKKLIDGAAKGAFTEEDAKRALRVLNHFITEHAETHTLAIVEGQLKVKKRVVIEEEW